jgi:hypothetical protein
LINGAAINRELMRSWYKMVAVALLLFSLVLLCYIPTLSVNFFHDDYSHLRNVYLMFHGHPELIWRSLSSAYVDPRFGLHYRPFLLLAQVSEWCLFGTNSMLLHLADVLLHGLNSFLVFAASYRIFRLLKTPQAFSIAIWSSIFFAIHPFHAEGLNWWCTNVDIFFTSWYLGSFWCFAEFLASEKRSLFIAALLCCLLALGTKETAVTLPAVLSVLAIISKEKIQPDKLWQSSKQVFAFWLVLLAFWGLRTFCLGTVTGGYYGPLTADWLGTFSQRFVETNVLQSLCYPVYPDGPLFAPLITCLAVLYMALAGILLTDLRCGRATPACFYAFLFAFSFLLFAGLPICYVWCPSPDLNGSRLLYLPCLGLCWLACLVLFSSAETKPALFRHILAAALAMVLAISLFESHFRWLSASKFSQSLIEQLKPALKSLTSNQHLVLMTIPNNIRGVLAFYRFDTLEDAFKMPFAQSIPWEQLDSMEPHYYLDPTAVSLSRLRRFACEPDKFKLLDCNLNWHDNSVSLSPVDLSRFADKPAPTELDISEKNIIFNPNKSGCSLTIPLPQQINSSDYQFLRLKLRSKFNDKCKQMHLFWKSADMKTFDEKMSRAFLTNEWRNRAEITLHLGELLDWLRCPKVDSLAISSDNDLQLESVSLLPDINLVPRLTRSPGKCREIAGGAILPRDGKFYLDFDTAKINGACGTRVELAPPATCLNAYSRSYSDPKFATHLQTAIVLHSLKGTLCLPDPLKSPLWQQIRIMALSADGDPLGFSSDPLYLQSRPDP